MNKESINIEMVTNPYGDQAFRATVEILFSTDVHFTDSAHEFISRALDNRWQVDDWAIVDTRGEK